MWPGVCTARRVKPPVDRIVSPSATVTSGLKSTSRPSFSSSSVFASSVSSDGSWSSSSVQPSTMRCGPIAYVGAPVSAFSHAASGEWSPWQWVMTMPTHSRLRRAAAIASRWLSIRGPGSITTARSPPITYVPVPR